MGASFQQVNLVSDTSIFGAAKIDVNLGNPWGIAIGPTGILWIAANHTGSTVIYDGQGNTILPAISIPLNGMPRGASPSGAVFNGTTDFVIPANGKPGKFIYSTEDGILSAWNSGTSTITVADRSGANAVYKGLAIANDGTGNFLYATDFHNGKVDVYDNAYHYVTNKPFIDPGIPAGFAPFNIQNINNELYVTYAKQKAPDAHDDEAGAGNGFVDVYKPDGSFVKRFASQGPLNSPWGIAQVPAGFGIPQNDILVGNFGDGRINIYDSTGSYQGQMKGNGTPISIQGLWAIVFPQSSAGGLNTDWLYFTAGPQAETFGLFGYLQKQ